MKPIKLKYAWHDLLFLTNAYNHFNDLVQDKQDLFITNPFLMVSAVITQEFLLENSAKSLMNREKEITKTINLSTAIHLRNFLKTYGYGYMHCNQNSSETLSYHLLVSQLDKCIGVFTNKVL